MTSAAQGSSIAATLPRSASIISPIVEFLCVGGLSLIVFVPLLLSGDDLNIVGIAGFGAVLWAQILVNYAHFMASYRIVYRDRAMILKHRWATIWVPLIMVVCFVAALIEAQGGGRLGLTVFFAVASGYLAWHYTGQTWGMMVSFTHLQGLASTEPSTGSFVVVSAFCSAGTWLGSSTPHWLSRNGSPWFTRSRPPLRSSPRSWASSGWSG